MDSFLKVFRIQLFSKVLYIGHVAMFHTEINICDIYNMFCAILIEYFTQNLFRHLITPETII